jgi:hypothetical protein
MRGKVHAILMDRTNIVNWLLRLIDAIAVSRLRKAEEEIRRHGHLLPDAWEREAYRLAPTDQHPFTR